MAARKLFAHIGTVTIATKNKITKLRGIDVSYDVQDADGQGAGTYWKNPIPVKRGAKIELDLMSSISSTGVCIGRSLEVTAFTTTHDPSGANRAYNHLGDWKSIELSIQNEVEDAEGGSEEWKEPQIKASSLSCKGTMLVPKDTMNGAQQMFMRALMAGDLQYGTGCIIPDHTFKLLLAFSGSTFTSADDAFLLTSASLKGNAGDFFTIDMELSSRGSPGAWHSEAVSGADALRELAFEHDSPSVATLVFETAASTTSGADFNITGTNMLIESYSASMSSGEITQEKMTLLSVANNVSMTAV